MNHLSSSQVLIGTASWAANYGIANSSKLRRKDLPSVVERSLSRGFAGFDVAHDYAVKGNVFSQAVSAEIFSKVSHKLSFEFSDLIRKTIEAELIQMRRESLTGLAAHSTAEFLRTPSQAVSLMEQLKELGLIQAWGVSLYTLAECRAVLSVASPDYIQAPVSAIDGRFTKLETQDLLARSGTRLHGRSLYLQGALLLDEGSLPFHLRDLSPHLLRIREAAELQGVTVPQFLLSNVAMTTGVDRAIVGINSVDQLEETSAYLEAEVAVDCRLPSKFVLTEDHPILDPRNW